MKRMICILLMMSMLLSVGVINSTALETDVNTEQAEIEAQVMAEVDQAFDELGLELGYKLSGEKYVDIWDYYCHFVNESTIDYVYVEWSTNIASDAVVGDRYLDYCIRSAQISHPTIGLYIYDIENEKIYTFEEAEVHARDYLQDFLDNHREEIVPYYNVYICGDVDFDDELTILDAVEIQKYHAGLVGFPYKEAFWRYPKGTIYVSDVDNDGERSVLDATAIQLKLAGLSE